MSILKRIQKSLSEKYYPIKYYSNNSNLDSTADADDFVYVPSFTDIQNLPDINVSGGSGGGGNIYHGSTTSPWTIRTSEYTNHHCHLCGGKGNTGSSFFGQSLCVFLCGDCECKVAEEFRKIIFSRLIPKDSKKHCDKCLSHLNACSCEETVALDKLERYA